MNILLLGANGQVGWELQRALAPLGAVTACDFDTPAPHTADFSHPDTLSALVQAVRPALIVNAAAHTAVDKAEEERDLAYTINRDTPAAMAGWSGSSPTATFVGTWTGFWIAARPRL